METFDAQGLSVRLPEPVQMDMTHTQPAPTRKTTQELDVDALLARTETIDDFKATNFFVETWGDELDHHLTSPPPTRKRGRERRRKRQDLANTAFLAELNPERIRPSTSFPRRLRSHTLNFAKHTRAVARATKKAAAVVEQNTPGPGYYSGVRDYQTGVLGFNSKCRPVGPLDLKPLGAGLAANGRVEATHFAGTNPGPGHYFPRSTHFVQAHAFSGVSRMVATSDFEGLGKYEAKVTDQAEKVHARISIVPRFADDFAKRETVQLGPTAYARVVNVGLPRTDGPSPWPAPPFRARIEENHRRSTFNPTTEEYMLKQAVHKGVAFSSVPRFAASKYDEYNLFIQGIRSRRKAAATSRRTGGPGRPARRMLIQAYSASRRAQRLDEMKKDRNKRKEAARERRERLHAEHLAKVERITNKSELRQLELRRRATAKSRRQAAVGWLFYLKLASRTQMLAERVRRDRMERSFSVLAHQAAGVIQRFVRRWGLRARSRVERRAGIVILCALRRNVTLWRLRRKNQSSDVLVATMVDLREKSYLLSAIRAYRGRAVTIQRAWRSFLGRQSCSIGLLVLQWRAQERHVEDAFRTEEGERLFVEARRKGQWDRTISQRDHKLALGHGVRFYPVMDDIAHAALAQNFRVRFSVYVARKAAYRHDRARRAHVQTLRDNMLADDAAGRKVNDDARKTLRQLTKDLGASVALEEPQLRVLLPARQMAALICRSMQTHKIAPLSIRARLKKMYMAMAKVHASRRKRALQHFLAEREEEEGRPLRISKKRRREKRKRVDC